MEKYKYKGLGTYKIVIDGKIVVLKEGDIIESKKTDLNDNILFEKIIDKTKTNKINRGD